MNIAGINIDLRSLAAGIAASALIWIIIRGLLSHFRPMILKFIANKGIRTLARWLDHGIDQLRDKGDKETAKIIRGMVQEAINNAPQVFKEELNDDD